MATPLKLEIVMSMVDKVLAPLRGVDRQSKSTAQGLRDTRASLKQLEKAQSDIAEFRKLRGGMRETESSLQATQNRIRQLAQEMAKTASPTKAMTKDFTAAKREAAQLGERMQQQSIKAQGLRDKLTSAGISVSSLATHERNLRGSIASTTAELNRKTDALRRQGEQQRKLTAIQEQQSKAAMRSAATMGAGYGGLQAGRTTGSAFTGFMAEGVEFDATMSKVQALARLQKNSADLAALRQQAKDLGDSTMFSATEAAQGQAFLAMAGFKPKAIMDAMPGMLDMAKAGDVEIGRTSDISSNILSAFGIDPSQMGKVADILTKTFTSSNVSLEMLGNTMSYVGPVARAAGVDLETTATMAGLLGNVGIQGDKAGTAMRAMLLRLSAPTSGAAKQLKELGINTKDAQGNIKPIIPLLAEIAAKTEKMGSGDQMAALKDIFGEEPAAAMTEIINKAGSNGIVDYLKVVRENQGAAAETAKVMADNMRGSLDELSSSWDTVRINIGESNDGWMRATIDSLTEITRGVGNWAKENPALTKALSMIAVVLAVVMAGFGVLAITLGLVVGKVMLVRFALAQLGVQGGLLGGIVRVLAGAFRLAGTTAMWLGRLLLANPIGLAVTGIATAAFLIYRYWEPIKGFFSDIWNSLSTGAAALPGVFVAWFAQVFAFMATLPAKFGQFGVDMMQGLISGITGALGGVRDAITGAASSAIGSFKDTLGILSLIHI